MERKGAGVLAEHDAELRKSLSCSFDIVEQVIKAKELSKRREKHPPLNNIIKFQQRNGA